MNDIIAQHLQLIIAQQGTAHSAKYIQGLQMKI